MATVRSSRVSRPWYTLPSTSFQSCFPEVISRGGFCRPVRDDVEGQRAGVNRGTTDKALAVFRAQATVQKRAAKAGVHQRWRNFRRIPRWKPPSHFHQN